ncbi:MAG: hypothetical protein EOM26_10165 [Alphaproteobacteria bacterium]|nr:hypothetical protein [Alphaproteobacteria bacterium]
MTSTPESWKYLLEAQRNAIDGMESREFLHHGPGDVREVIDRCAFGFEDDFIFAGRKLQRLFDFPYFENDKGRYASALRNTLADWQSGSGPSLPALIAAYIDSRGVTAQEGRGNPLVNAALTGAVLAEASGDKLPEDAYHCTVHFREVTLLNMIAVDGEEYVTGRTSGLDVALRQIIVAVAHDLFHTGKDNELDGTYVPYYLERRSFDAFEPYMRRFGMSEADIEDIRVGILVTEIKKGDDQQFSAHQYLRQAYGYHFCGASMPGLPSELSLLLSDETRDGSTRGRELTRMCVRMQESDTVASVLDEDSFMTRYRLLQNENPARYPPMPGIKAFIGFMGYIFSDGIRSSEGPPEPLSPFYRAWMQQRIHRVYEQAVARMQSEAASASDKQAG